MPTTSTTLKLISVLVLTSLWFGGSCAHAQSPADSILGSTKLYLGSGAVGPGTDMSLGFHANARRQLIVLHGDALPNPLSAFNEFSIDAEILYQQGNGRWLVSTGLVTRLDLAGKRFPVRSYLIPVSIGLIASQVPRSPDANVGLGYGFGLGADIPVYNVALSIEARTIGHLVDRSGNTAGLPVSVGVRF